MPDLDGDSDLATVTWESGGDRAIKEEAIIQISEEQAFYLELK